jgi:dihydrofolate reductase
VSTRRLGVRCRDRRLPFDAWVNATTKETPMATTVLDMSMSLDGYIAGPNERIDNGLGDGGERLHEWVFPAAEANKVVLDELLSTSAVVAGKGTFEPADGWNGDHHDGVPIFIYSRTEPGIDISDWPLVTYLDSVETAFERAREAAGDGTVLVHGAAVAQVALAAGLLDEIQLHLIPVLLGGGRRLFGELGLGQLELELARVQEGEAGVTHLRYRVTGAPRTRG